jgi:hypothetical protein
MALLAHRSVAGPASLVARRPTPAFCLTRGAIRVQVASQDVAQAQEPARNVDDRGFALKPVRLWW